MRDVLIHAYHGVDLRIVWETVWQRLPETRAQMQQLLDAWSDADGEGPSVPSLDQV